MSLEIKVMHGEKSSQKIKQPDPNLPQLHFCWLIIGPRGRGKSNLVKNLLLRKEMYKNIFPKDSIFIFSQSIDLNDDYKKVRTKYKFANCDPALVQEIISAQEGIIKEYGKRRTKPILMIFDDCLDSRLFRQSGILEKVAARGRHAKISIIIVSQSYNRVSRDIRINCDAISVFEPNNLSELDRITEQNLNKAHRKNFVDRAQAEWDRNPYAFIHVNPRAKSLNERFKLGFEESLFSRSAETKSE